MQREWCQEQRKKEKESEPEMEGEKEPEVAWKVGQNAPTPADSEGNGTVSEEQEVVKTP